MPRHLLRRNPAPAPDHLSNNSPQQRFPRARLNHLPAQSQFHTPPSGGIPQLHPSSGPIDATAPDAPEPVRRAAAAQAALFSLFGRGVTGRPQNRSSMIDDDDDDDEELDGSPFDDDDDDLNDPEGIETDQGPLDLDHEGAGNEVDLSEDDIEGMAGEEIDEEEDELMHDRDKSPSPLPTDLREISSLASWTVSTHKPGCGVAALRNPDHLQYWQSDGPQPHTLTLHFFKLVAVVKIRVYLDFGLDESYTPTKMMFLAGMGGNDLVEFATWEGEGPCGWVDVPLEGVGGQNGGWVRKRQRHRRRSTVSGRKHDASSAAGGSSRRAGKESKGKGSTGGIAIWADDSLFSEEENPGRSADEDGEDVEDDEEEDYDDDSYAGSVLKAMVVQMRIMENHQNGKDTHVRGFQVFARDDDRRRMGNAPSASADGRIRRYSARKSLRGAGNDDGMDGRGDGIDGDIGKVTGLEEPDWMGDPVIR